jgi:hypothetical protein
MARSADPRVARLAGLGVLAALSAVEACGVGSVSFQDAGPPDASVMDDARADAPIEAMAADAGGDGSDGAEADAGSESGGMCALPTGAMGTCCGTVPCVGCTNTTMNCAMCEMKCAEAGVCCLKGSMLRCTAMCP